MRVFKKRDALGEWLRQERSAGKTVGLVPTMGALHDGHLGLVNKARKENDVVVCSIFVNPIQFNNPADLKKYPRTPDSDLALLASAMCDAAFCPDEKEMYPEKETRVYDFGHLDKVMEGRFRHGHFNGVAIVVNKLFSIIQPHRAYFGEKDFQQLQIIKAMARIEGHDIMIVGCPTHREPDGLASSSRNRRLSEAQRREAPRIYQGLQMAAQMCPGHPPDTIKKKIISFINASAELEVEYFEMVRPDTLLPVKACVPCKKAIACIAVHAGSVRLIDNLAINS